MYIIVWNDPGIAWPSHNVIHLFLKHCFASCIAQFCKEEWQCEHPTICLGLTHFDWQISSSSWQNPRCVTLISQDSCLAGTRIWVKLCFSYKMCVTWSVSIWTLDLHHISVKGCCYPPILSPQTTQLHLFFCCRFWKAHRPSFMCWRKKHQRTSPHWVTAKLLFGIKPVAKEHD